MRIVLLLVVVLIVSLLALRQLNTSSPTHTEASIDKISEDMGSNPPKVPTKPQDVQAFGEQMNKFINDAASTRQKQIEQQKQ
ncbi:hypothetical protein [Sedimenticola sp.]|uniref:hypothetical protein n=1 Tax=Sedimenticola sp. TaxID=1940285 RepID=UPI003D0C607D